jgi:hypothetical protein
LAIIAVLPRGAAGGVSAITVNLVPSLSQLLDRISQVDVRVFVQYDF